MPQAFDDVVAPALALAEGDRNRDELFDDDYQQLLQSTREFLDEVAPEPSPAPESPGMHDHSLNELLQNDIDDDSPVLRGRVVGFPAREPVDEIGLSRTRGGSRIASPISESIAGFGIQFAIRGIPKSFRPDA